MLEKLVCYIVATARIHRTVAERLSFRRHCALGARR